MQNFSYMPGRMEKIISRKGFIVYVDYAHTPESLEVVYKSLRPKANRLIAVLVHVVEVGIKQNGQF